MHPKPWRSSSVLIGGSDRATVVELTVAAFQGVSIDHNLDGRLGPVAGRDWRWRKGRDIEVDIDMPGSELAVAEDDRSRRGRSVTSRCAIDPESRIGWIHNLAVDAGLRGQGLGRRLIEHALDRFRAAGMTVAKIETLEQNPIGRHLYPCAGVPGDGPPDPLRHAPGARAHAGLARRRDPAIRSPGIRSCNALDAAAWTRMGSEEFLMRPTISDARPASPSARHGPARASDAPRFVAQEIDPHVGNVCYAVTRRTSTATASSTSWP